MPLPAPDAARLFTLGTRYDCGRGMTATVTGLPQAELRLSTGQVAACDPFIGLGDDADPFTVAVAPGSYPVVTSVVRITRADFPAAVDSRVAAAWLRVSAEPTVAWELALGDGQRLDALEEAEFYGYGVDAGTGCFVDAAASTALGDFLGEEYELLNDALFGNEVPEPVGPVALTDPASGHNVVAFASGWGDGCYPTWLGRDADGRVTGYLTEFFVVPQPGRGPVDEE
ncbi:DUF4241 domain-containing protein [Kitasatospora sp. NBC_01266]|uniref:DUF4241 domain-containing protein n=1 Tax=Kitasatospora sp. NBC_01266 TaxID=2903572 RepID=UPI002E2F080B|nr:DUF4241 domain-containing protein [Kitasatospora sp. NBC_01266]